jgi:hypothetical protein
VSARALIIWLSIIYPAERPRVYAPVAHPERTKSFHHARLGAEGGPDGIVSRPRTFVSLLDLRLSHDARLCNTIAIDKDDVIFHGTVVASQSAGLWVN